MLYRTPVTFALVLTALAASACDNRSNQAQSTPPAETPSAPDTTVSAEAPNTVDADFVKKAAIAGMFEVESSQLALDRLTNPELKTFAEMMVTDHTKAGNELKGIVEGGQVPGITTVPAELDSDHRAKLEQLKAAGNGPAFDAKYQELQLDGHKQAVALFENETTSGKSEPLKAWAAQTLPKLKEHLGRIQTLAPAGQ